MAWLVLLLLQDPPREFTDGAGLRFVLVPAGTYVRGMDEQQERTLGSKFPTVAPADNQQDTPTEKPAHEVRISRPFYLGIHEVSVAQFRGFAKSAGYVTEAERNGRGSRGFDPKKGEFTDGAAYTWKSPGFAQDDAHPVVGVSWNDAVAFCAWLGAREKASYRLPTEAEWEYACRAGTRTWLSFGDGVDGLHRRANLADVSLEKAHPGMTSRERLVDPARDPADGFAYTSPVGTFPPNPWGLHDLHGNVWEWCQDRYQRFAYKPFGGRKKDAPAVVDPQGPDLSDEHGEWRVLRGGSWASSPVTARSSSRLWGDQSDAFCWAGFRVVRVP